MATGDPEMVILGKRVNRARDQTMVAFRNQHLQSRRVTLLLDDSLPSPGGLSENFDWWTPLLFYRLTKRGTVLKSNGPLNPLRATSLRLTPRCRTLGSSDGLVR